MRKLVTVFGALALAVATLVATPADAAVELDVAGVRVITNNAGDVIINGDNGDSELELIGGNGTVRVLVAVPFEEEPAEVVVPLSRNLRVNLRGGDNSVSMSGVTVPGLLSYTGTSGVDLVSMFLGSIGRTATIRLGSGPDLGDELSSAEFVEGFITDGTRFGGNVSVLGAAGHQLVCIDSCSQFVAPTVFERNLRIATGSGSSDVRIGTDVRVDGRLSVAGGRDSDFFVADGAFFGANPTISQSSGSDSALVFGGSWTGTLRINSGNGDDFVDVSIGGGIEGQGVDPRIDVNLGRGDDELELSRGVDPRSRVNGGVGTDRLCTAIEGLVLRSVEEIVTSCLR